MFLLQRSEKKWPLDALMSITQIKFHVTDQRDKVYALLGLAAENGDNSPGQLRPDYNIHVTQLYQKVARFLLEQNGSLAMLTRTRGTRDSLDRLRRQHDIGNVPSWVPDWSDFSVFNREIRTSLSWIEYSDTSKSPYLGFPKHYNASKGLELKVHDTGDASVLRVNGMRVDEIAQVINLNEEALSRDGFNQNFALQIERIYDAAIKLLAGNDILSWTKHFIKVTTAEQHQLCGSSWDQTFKDGTSYLHDLISSNENHMSAWAKSGGAQAMDHLHDLSIDGKPGKYAALAQNFCFNRSFMITKEKRMGIGPSDTAVGDVVAVIPGGAVPYITRQGEAGWTFVGESYIDGLMAGEAVREYQQGIIKEETFDFH
ncbi:hypothetical protein F4819DRAFT_472441 [Hypoxylon fuscum]|nr:hypothetical protein F4819DRAFT_472441 [Hypoxylon fuscum]